MFFKKMAIGLPGLFALSMVFGICIATTEADAECIVDVDGTYIEAEHFTNSSQLASPSSSVNEFTLVADASYNNGYALQSGSGGYFANDPGNEVKEYELSFPQAGTYQIWMRGKAGGNGSTDSMFFTLDSDTWKAWNYGTNLSTLTWTSSMQIGTDNSIEVTVVAPGTHTLKIAMREPSAVIDGFYITTGNEIPTDSVMDPANKTVLDPQAGCTGPYWSSDNALVGVTNYVGYNAPSTTVTISNIGEDDTQAATISVDQAWVTLDSTNMAALLSGETHTMTLSFATAALAAGTHSAEITITGGANNSGMTIPITLLVKEAPSTAACGEVPLYAQNLVNPAIMVQLDTSGSMSTSMSLATTVDQDTPALTSIVQSIVNRTNWAPNNSMGFVIGGTGSRRTWTYDGNTDDAPLLTIEYDSGGSTVTVEQRVFGSGNDVQGVIGSLNATATYLELGRSGEPVGLRFTDVNVPQGATITDAYLSFTAYQGDDGTTNLIIEGVDEDNVSDFNTTPSFTGAVNWSPGSWLATMQRIDIAEDVLAEVFQDQSIAWGFANWSGGGCNAANSDDSPDYYTDYLVGCHDHDQTHYDALQNHVYDGSTGGCTPLVPTMRGGLEYFKENRIDNNYSEAYTKLDCQPRILVIVTDGQGNTATDNDRIDTVVADLIAEGVSVVAVGFGLTNANQLDRIVKAMQIAGELDDEDDIFHLHNEDASGIAIPFMAQNRQEFIEAMNDIVKAVKAQVFYGSSPAATASANDEDIGVLVSASFDASDWTGSLNAKKFDAYTGEVEATATWTTTTTLSGATINGFIADASGGVTPYTDSSITGDNFLCKPLGDIINSVPQLIGNPPYFYNFDGYTSFKYNSSVRAREDMAYVAANDGALHAFNVSDGSEMWRFYPNSVVTDLSMAGNAAVDDMCSSAYCHKFLLDGSPQAADIFVDHDSVVSTDKLWKTFLVTGQGKGGKSFFGLDVTYGNDFDSSTNPSSLLWEYSSSDLGLATSTPDTVRVSVFDEATISPTIATSETAWITIFGSGSASTSAEQAEKEAYIFAINSWDSTAVWEDASENDVASVKLSATTLKNDKPGSPIVVDIFDDDYLYDAIYVGNLYGGMYRVSSIGMNQVPVVRQIYNSGLTDHTSPTTAKAEVAFMGDNEFWVYFGTGRYEDQVDKFTVDQQYFFGLQDNFDYMDSTDTSKDELHEVAERTSPYTMSDLVTLTTGIIEGYVTDSAGDPVDSDGDGTVDSGDLLKFRTLSCSFPDAEGYCNPNAESWALELAIPTDSGSERVISRPLIVAGIAFFATFVPDADVCAGDGETWLFAINMETGGLVTDSVFDLNDDGIYDESDREITTDLTGGTSILIGGIYIGEGKPSDELVLHNDILFVGTSTQPPIPLKVNLPDQRTKLKAWRQKFN